MQEFTLALENGETIQDKFTCRRIELDLKPAHYDSASVKRTRKLLQASQNVFALLLGVSVKTLQSWEQGTQPPSKIACRFMDEIKRNPDYWTQRFKNAILKTLSPGAGGVSPLIPFGVQESGAYSLPLSLQPLTWNFTFVRIIFLIFHSNSQRVPDDCPSRSA